jgi:hypothetical protein
MRFVGIASPGLGALRQYLRPQSRLLLVLGHPRCGSAYAAKLASSVGLDIGHEKMGEHGISSWMFAVPDLRAPFGTDYGGAPLNSRFNAVVHHLRDPFEAAASIMLENNVTVSFRYRRAHIEAEFGFDLFRYDLALDRAMASYLFWNKLCEVRAPHFTFRIEQDGDLLLDFLRKEFAGFLAPAETQQEIGKVNTYDDHFSKTGMKKPNLSAGDWSKLDSSLREPLRQFCQTYGYEYRL